MKLSFAVVAAVLTGAAAAPMRSSRSLLVRGGAVVIDDDLVPRKRINIEQAIPLAVAVPSVIVGLDMLFEPERTAKFLEGDHVMTDGDKRAAMGAGVTQVVKGLAIAAIALRTDHDSLRVANGLTLLATAFEEATYRRQVQEKGARGLTSRSRSLTTVIRGVISAATLWALYSLRGADVAIDTTTAPYLERPRDADSL